jgi:two-component system sensor histidine kinase DesK
VTNVTAGCPHTNLLSLVWSGDNEEDMEILLTPSPTVSLPRPKSRRLVRVARSPRTRAADELIRLASAGAVTFSIAVPIVIVVLFATTPSVWHHFPEAAAATALYLPLYVHHVRYGLRGERPRFLLLTLGAMAVVIVGVTPLLGAEWFYAYSAIVASVLVTTPPRFSFPAVGCTLAGVGIWVAELRNDSGIHIYGGGLTAYFPIAVAERAAAVFILVWLVGALRRVQSARVALAEVALEAERGRIDIELSESVVSELEEVIMKGIHAEDAARRGSPKVEEELEALVKGSRLALANARRIIRQYKVVSPAAELEKAALLLRSAGIEATIVIPDTDLPLTLDESLRSALQVAVAQLLSEDVAGPVVLKLGCASGRFRLETLRPSKDEPAA